MTTSPELKPGIRWWRVIGGGLLIELGLTLVAVPFFASGQTEATLLVIPPATLVIAAIVGWWVARRTQRALLNATLAGGVAFLLYVVMAGAGSLFAPQQADMSMALSPSYLASHIFKVVGAALGGCWVARKRAGQAQAA